MYCVAWPGSSELEVGAKIFFADSVAECSIVLLSVLLLLLYARCCWNMGCWWRMWLTGLKVIFLVLIVR